MAMAENFAPFFNESDFATSAVLAGVTVSGIFADGYAVGGVGIGMATGRYTFVLPTAAVPVDVVGQGLSVGGTSYVVAAAQPDGTGITTLELELP